MTAGRGHRIAQRFELDSLLPDVGLGECWSALDLQRPDAPTQVELLAEPAATGATREAFEAQLTRLRRLSNVGVLGVLGGGESEGRLYVVSEHLEGRSLASWLGGHRQAGTRPGLAVVQRLFDRMCSAVQFAHAVAPQPVVHRALSPRSVVMRRAGPGQHHVKVGDFGLAPFAPGAARGAVGPWWEYQAPEQQGARWSEPGTVDVFALGVILTEMLSLSALPPPGESETWWQLVAEGRALPLDRLVTIRADVPHGVWEAVAGALNAPARERTASVARLQRAVRDAWQAAGTWQVSGGAETEPPAPMTFADVTVVRAAPRGMARPAPVDVKATAPMMAAVLPGGDAPTETTEMIDLARRSALPDHRAESTVALDVAGLDPGAYRGAAGAPPVAALFGEALGGDSDLDPAVSTQLMSRPAGGDPEPAVGATLKAPPRRPSFDPAPPRSDEDLRATTVMKAARPATMAPAGFIARGVAGDPFVGDSFAEARASMPPVEPTMAVPIEAMLAGARSPYGSARPSTPGAAATPSVPFAMGAPQRDTLSVPSPAPAATILGQPAWIMLALAAVVVVCVGASAFLLAGGR